MLLGRLAHRIVNRRKAPETSKPGLLSSWGAEQWAQETPSKWLPLSQGPSPQPEDIGVWPQILLSPGLPELLHHRSHCEVGVPQSNIPRGNICRAFAGVSLEGPHQDDVRAGHILPVHQLGSQEQKGLSLGGLSVVTH